MIWIRRSRRVREGGPGFRAGLHGFGGGILVGLVMMSGVLIIMLVLGGGNLRVGDEGFSRYFSVIVPLVFYLLIASLGEEWIFRGYTMSRFSEVVGSGRANVVVAFIFMAGHWGGDGWTTLTAVNIFVFSLVNGAMRVTPGGFRLRGVFISHGTACRSCAAHL